MSCNILITICGRAGSKGLKNKNLKIFLGFPLIYYTLSAAMIFKESLPSDNKVDICLNTDSEELSEIVIRKYPEVKIIKRLPELSGDLVPKPAVWKNCVDTMQKVNGIFYDYMIDLDITSPLRQADDVFNAFHLKQSRMDADLVESMCYSRRNPYFNMMQEDGRFVKTVIDCSFAARQQAPVVYDENASIYVLNSRYFIENGDDMKYVKTIPYIMRDTAVLDIDSEDDFIMMEVVGKYLYENEESYKKVRDNIRN